MSLITRAGRITVKPFAVIPALGDLNLREVARAESSVSNVSSTRGVGDELVAIMEGCFVSGTIKYTHELAHWVNAVRTGDPKETEALIQDVLCVYPLTGFELDLTCNRSFLEMYIHRSLDLYAMIAITPSLPTLDTLIEMVRGNNTYRQELLNETGVYHLRSLDFLSTGFKSPTFELIALHPHHFLPSGNLLTVYNRTANTFHHYMPSATGSHLIDTVAGGVFPTIDPPPRMGWNSVNVFLVALNAEIKLRRHHAVGSLTSLSPDHQILAERTMTLVDLLYWQLRKPAEGSIGAHIVAGLLKRNSPRDARPQPGSTMELGDASSHEDDRRPTTPRSAGESKEERQIRKRYDFDWFADVDLETRLAYGRSLMCGHDLDYPEELFENAIPLENS